MDREELIFQEYKMYAEQKENFIEVIKYERQIKEIRSWDNKSVK